MTLLAQNEEQQKQFTSLPFQTFILIAMADSTLSAREMEVYLNMISKRRWCKSNYAKDLLAETAALHSELWKAYQSGELSIDLFGIQETIQALNKLLFPTEAKAFREDMYYLARAIARASGGFMGVGSICKEEKERLDELSLALDGQLLTEEQQALKDSGVFIPPPHAEYMPVATIASQDMMCWQQGKIRVKCINIIDVTHDVKTFRFVTVPPSLFSYKPGQFLNLELQIDGKKVIRSYTISSTPSRPHTIEITIKRVPGGLVSNWLHDNFRKGDEAFINGPAGKLTCFDYPARKLLMISAGSGITPVMSMSRWLYDTAADCDIIFFYAARNEKDIIFRQELEMLVRQYENFKLFITLTRSDLERGWQGLRGRVNPDMIKQIAPDFRERFIFLCGPNGFMASVKELMQSLNFPMENYHAESFGAPRKLKPKVILPKPTTFFADLLPTPKGLPAQPLNLKLGSKKSPSSKAATGKGSDRVVVFAQSGQEIESDEDTTILELAEEHGISIPSACRAGVCGSCKVLKLSGEVIMESTEGLEEEELNEGHILTCVACVKGKVVVEA